MVTTNSSPFLQFVWKDRYLKILILDDRCIVKLEIHAVRLVSRPLSSQREVYYLIVELDYGDFSISSSFSGAWDQHIRYDNWQRVV